MVLARGRLKQEDHYEFEASLDCILRFRLMKKKTRKRKKKRRKRNKMGGRREERRKKMSRERRHYIFITLGLRRLLK